MDYVVYESRVHIERQKGPIRTASLPGEPNPVTFGVHGAIAEHYGVDTNVIEAHATTVDYLVAAVGG
ncbi:MAG: hypothetical protein ABI718_09855 [Acidobacteriota bacterium]